MPHPIPDHLRQFCPGNVIFGDGRTFVRDERTLVGKQSMFFRDEKGLVRCKPKLLRHQGMLFPDGEKFVLANGGFSVGKE